MRRSGFWHNTAKTHGSSLADSLIPMMKLRLARPEHLVDLRDLDELRGIRIEPDAVIIGATTTQHELIDSELLTTRCPILRETALQIADPQVRYCG
jgi:aerobic carbon-monoxide dehydrogenase medium subunit